MRTWLRAIGGEMCGGPCGQQLPAGAPMLHFALPGITQRILRCVPCAGEKPPPDLPTAVTLPKSSEPVALKSLLPLDWRARQAHEREPGEEG